MSPTIAMTTELMIAMKNGNDDGDAIILFL
jgi:hypothetical protein